MNRIFRIVWSQAQQAWVVVSELAMRCGKAGSRAALGLLVLALPAQAADRYWDANGTAVGLGGTGTWDTTGLFWSPNADGVSGPYGAWNNAALDNAIFAGTAGTVTLGSPITVHNLTFNAHGYTITGGTLTLAGVTPTVHINSGAATIASSLAGTAGLTKDGAGTATLAGNATFVAGTTLAGGVLDVDGVLATPTVALGDDTTLRVDGTLQAGAASAATLAGSAGVNAVVVGAGGTLLANGDLGAGNDLLDVAGLLDTGAGGLSLGAGDDVFTIHDDTDVVGIIAAGQGSDTIDADIAGQAGLGAVQAFERLHKRGDGVLEVRGPLPSDFDAVDVADGTLHVGAAGRISAMHTTVAAGATLDALGAFTGTAGDDTFLARGTVNGTLAFGAGNDAVVFEGADIDGLVGLDGGDGGADRLAFDGMQLGAALPTLSGWERGELRNGAVLQLAGPMILGHLSNPEASVLVIDPSSRLVVAAGARIHAGVSNAGTIDAGAHRLAIDGGYHGDDGLLQVGVSPANGTSGGLDVAGDVRGTTAIAFTGDGTDAAPGTSSAILVIASPNDDPATPGTFTTDGIVRLAGSASPWTLAQAADRNWYLNADAEALLPEIGGYAILPSVGLLALADHDRVLYQRMSAVRDDTPRCGTEPERERRAYWLLTGACRGAWMALSASEAELGADPGFAFSGDTLGLFLGADLLLQDRDTRTLRAGVVLGFQRGNHWTTGASSTAQQGIGAANVRTDTPSVGFYQSIEWRSGAYFDASLVAHRPEATIRVADGFHDDVPGSALALGARVGHRIVTAGGWQLDPQLQLEAVGMHWRSDASVDTGGAGVRMDDDVFGNARVALRAGKAFDTAGGAAVRPWVTLGVQDTFGDKRDALAMLPGGGAAAQAFPRHALDLAATLDVGVEVEWNAAVSLFGVLSVDRSLAGTHLEQRQANLGLRVRW